MTWFVYLLECSDSSLYCGITTNTSRRLKQHNSGKASKYTRGRLPVRVVWFREVEGRSKALKEEIRIKRMSTYDKWAIVFWDGTRTHTQRFGTRP